MLKPTIYDRRRVDFHSMYNIELYIYPKAELYGNSEYDIYMAMYIYKVPSLQHILGSFAIWHCLCGNVNFSFKNVKIT